MIQILHYQSKEEYQRDTKEYEKCQMSHIVSYTTKKGNIKVVKHRWGVQGKYTKEQYLKMILENVLVHKETKSPEMQLLQEGFKMGVSSRGCKEEK